MMEKHPAVGRATDELLTRWRRASATGGPVALMDILIGSWLEEEAQFQDLDPLIHELGPVVKALEEYEKMAKPAGNLVFLLGSVVFQALTIGNKMGPRIKNLKAMATLRDKKTAKARTKDQIIEARATHFRKLNPKRSVRSMALEICEKEKDLLKPDTVARKLAAMGF
jgi:hypothetical protein